MRCYRQMKNGRYVLRKIIYVNIRDRKPKLLLLIDDTTNKKELKVSEE